MKRNWQPFIAFLLMVAFAASAQASAWYVRTDGGPAPTCNGTANAPASAAPNCAFNNPQWVLTPGYTTDGAGPLLLKDGDTLNIAAGSYGMGYGTPGAVSCKSAWMYACTLQQPMPSHVTIQGDCSATTELWGAKGIYDLLDLSGTDGATVRCLSVTDHSLCIKNYGPTAATGGVTACKDGDDYATNGLLVQGANNLTLDHVDIHGIAQYGIMIGKLTGTTLVNNLTLRANGWGGWNGDLGGNDTTSSDTGTLTFNNLVVSWNGCAEAYPATTIVGCWGQSNGGYGDGFGEAATAGDWTFNNATFYQNTSDGLDLLYHRLGGSITINGGIFWGSIGNQIKVAGNATISRAVVNGMCNNFAAYPVGGAGGNSSNNCRAAGTAIVMVQGAPNETSTLSHNTITGNGDTLLVGEGGTAADGSEYTPDASNVWAYDNNIFLGQPSAYKVGEQTALDWYSDGTFGGTVKYTNNIVWNVKNNVCPAGSICKDPLLTNETLQNFQWSLLPGSPAIGTGAQP